MSSNSFIDSFDIKNQDKHNVKPEERIDLDHLGSDTGLTGMIFSRGDQQIAGSVGFVVANAVFARSQFAVVANEAWAVLRLVLAASPSPTLQLLM